MLQVYINVVSKSVQTTFKQKKISQNIDVKKGFIKNLPFKIYSGCFWLVYTPLVL